MTRGQKKFLYGLLYLIILVLVVWGIVPKSPVQPACVGFSCGINQPLPLQLTEAARIFKSESVKSGILLASVQNPNADYGADAFSYEFTVSEKNGGVVAQISNIGNIYPGETRYIIGFYDTAGLDLKMVADQPDFKIIETNFRPAAGFLKPDLSLSSDLATQVGSAGIKVTGNLKNQSSFAVQNVKALALLENKYGDPIFAAQTIIQQVGGFKATPFEVSFPADQSIVENLVPDRTQVFFYAE